MKLSNFIAILADHLDNFGDVEIRIDTNECEYPEWVSPDIEGGEGFVEIYPGPQYDDGEMH